MAPIFPLRLNRVLKNAARRLQSSARKPLRDTRRLTAMKRDPSSGKSHRRNTAPMLSSPRCGAKTRSGQSCNAPRVSGKPRCRMHGGANGSGAPAGNSNALKHGLHTKEARERRSAIRRLIRDAEETLAEVE
ncbi:HGGxSTG domain-containing protein [Qipengyuania citrea]|uniref:HGGxSTG domain-containing protein n=1 Tax=Qipengyuania citrea TaxID=225971 RepID=UPI003D663171